MPRLVPGIHVFPDDVRNEVVDGRDKPGHDEQLVGQTTARPSRLSAFAFPLRGFKSNGG